MSGRDNISDAWAIVLAAGKSERMGTPKMLLPFGEKSMLEIVIRRIREAGLTNVVVVLGSNREEIENVLRHEAVETCFNPQYSGGMHTSVITGFNHIPDQAEAVLLFLGDQPMIPREVILKVFDTWKTSGKSIIIPTYKGSRGHPTLFDFRLKKEILQMDPATGLRSVLARFHREICEVEVNYPEILRDIDTKIDYLNELNQISGKWKKK